MDISPNNIVGTCNFKCNYIFKYSSSSSIATNYGSYISLTYEASNTPPVLYNDVKYNVSSIQLYSPSLHLFNGSKATGEIIVIHTPVAGSTSGISLYVCIPISIQGGQNPNQIITTIINAVSTGAPSAGENTSQIAAFSLNDVIPKKPFYSYSSSSIDFIIFGSADSVVISSDTLATFTKCIPTMPSLSFPSGPKLFVNSKGPSSSLVQGEDDIYIDCRPTGSSEESVLIASSSSTKSATTNDLNAILSSPYFFWILFAILFIIVILVLNHSLSIHF